MSKETWEKPKFVPIDEVPTGEPNPEEALILKQQERAVTEEDVESSIDAVKEKLGIGTEHEMTGFRTVEVISPPTDTLYDRQVSEAQAEASIDATKDVLGVGEGLDEAEMAAVHADAVARQERMNAKIAKENKREKITWFKWRGRWGKPKEKDIHRETIRSGAQTGEGMPHFASATDENGDVDIDYGKLDKAA